MRTLHLDANQPGDLDRAAALLRAGQVVALPTETVYGLAARADSAAAVARIFTAKGRPADNPLIVHVADAAQARAYAAAWPETAERLAAAYWPGPLTLVVARAPGLPDVVTSGLSTVALRCPDHPTARALIRAAGPLAAPSANRSGSPSPTTAAHVRADLDGRIAAIVDGGACLRGLESTVVDVRTRPPTVLRPGAIPIEALQATLGEVALHPAVDDPADAADARAPGMRHRHYSPRATLWLLEGPDSVARARALLVRHPAAHALLLGATSGPPAPRERAFPDAERFGVALYAALRELDDLGVPLILVAGVGDATLERTLRNRLRKAASQILRS